MTAASPPVSAGTDNGSLVARVTSLLDEFAAMSAPGEGVTRIGYSALEREAHAHFAEKMAALGLEVRVDAAGNTIAELAGSDPARPALGTGSHLDSVPQGGRFDGIAGVVAAMVAAEVIVERDLRMQHPLRFVVFACEEGARFGQACIGSRFAAGLLTADDVDARRDAQGTSIAQAMASVGLNAQVALAEPWQATDWAAFVELHVEQGRELTRMDVPVGLVDLISGSTRLQLEITGQASHTGATTMDDRADALAAAAEVVLLAESLARDSRHRGTRITVGQMKVLPGSITTIPGSVLFSVDVRDVDSDRQRTTASELTQLARSACERRGVELEVRLLGDASPVVLPAWLRDELVHAAEALQVPAQVMVSGASHDAQMINKIMPAGMIFVPSPSGLSHVPVEFTPSEDIVVGTSVLIEGLSRLDSLLSRLSAG